MTMFFKIPDSNQAYDLRTHSLRYWLWLSLVFVQTVGLALVIGATPFISNYVIKVTAPVYIQHSDYGLAKFALIFFIVLAISNGLAIRDVWRLKRWPLFFFIAKLVIVLLLIIAVFCLGIDRHLLFFVIPLSGSLCYMVLAYRWLLNLYKRRLANTK